MEFKELIRIYLDREIGHILVPFKVYISDFIAIITVYLNIFFCEIAHAKLSIAQVILVVFCFHFLFLFFRV